MEYSAFTTKAPSIVRELRNDVVILPGVPSDENVETKEWRGLWDTGATASCIHNRVKESMNLVAVGTKVISTANGVVEVDSCIIDVILPNRVKIEKLLVSCADLGDDVDILLGMDIIAHGNFSISNNGHTWHSLVIPSIGDVDYVSRVKTMVQVQKGHKKKKR